MNRIATLGYGDNHLIPGYGYGGYADSFGGGSGIPGEIRGQKFVRAKMQLDVFAALHKGATAEFNIFSGLLKKSLLSIGFKADHAVSLSSDRAVVTYVQRELSRNLSVRGRISHDKLIRILRAI